MRRVGVLDTLLQKRDVQANFCVIGSEVFDSWKELRTRIKDLQTLGHRQASEAADKRYIFDARDASFLQGLLQYHTKAAEKMGDGVQAHTFDVHDPQGRFVVMQKAGGCVGWSAKRAAEALIKVKAVNSAQATASAAGLVQDEDEQEQEVVEEEVVPEVLKRKRASSITIPDEVERRPLKTLRTERELCLAIVHGAERLGCYEAVRAFAALGYTPCLVKMDGDNMLCAFDAADYDALQTRLDEYPTFLGLEWELTEDTSVWGNGLKASQNAVREGRAFDPSQLPEGLTVLPDFLSEEEEQQLLHAYGDSSVEWDSNKVMDRRVAQYGYEFDYSTGRALHVLDRPISEHLRFLVERFRDGVEEEHQTLRDPDQVIVNEYYPGQGIGMHTDRTVLFDDTIHVVSVGSDASMTFTLNEEGDRRRVHIPIPRRSCYIMRGDCRFNWQHGLATLPHDTYNGCLVQRARRMSFTFRKVLNEARKRSGLCINDVVYATLAQLLHDLEDMYLPEEELQNLMSALLLLYPMFEVDASELYLDDDSRVHAKQSNGDVVSTLRVCFALLLLFFTTHPQDGRTLVWNLRDTAQRVFEGYHELHPKDPKKEVLPAQRLVATLAGKQFYSEQELHSYVADMPEGEAVGLQRYVLMALLGHHPAGPLMMRDGIKSIGKAGANCFSETSSGSREWSPTAAIRFLFKPEQQGKKRANKRDKGDN